MGVVAVDNSEHEIILSLPFEEKKLFDPNNEHEFRLIWTYRACDACANCAEIDRSIIVTDTTPPCLSEEPPSEEVECDNIPPPCEVVTVDESLPVITEFSEQMKDPVTQTIWITRTWSVTDLSGNHASYTQSLSVVDNSAPVFSRYPESEKVSCSCDSFPLAPTVNAIDNCDFSLTVKYSEDKINGISEDSYALERVWSAEDSIGNRVSHKQVITVIDDEKPVLSKTPVNREVECDNIPAMVNVYIKDNCDPEIVVTSEEMSVQGSCDYEYEIQRYWSGKDRTGNSVNHRQILHVRDTHAPQFEGQDPQCINPNNHYKEYSTKNMFSAFDGCSTDVSYANEKVSIYSCNSTRASSSAPNYFDVTCHFDRARSILSILANVDPSETNGRTYNVYAVAIDDCGNEAFSKREFWIPATEEDAAMEGLVCEEADVIDLVDNPYL